MLAHALVRGLHEQVANVVEPHARDALVALEGPQAELVARQAPGHQLLDERVVEIRVLPRHQVAQLDDERIGRGIRQRPVSPLSGYS